MAYLILTTYLSQYTKCANEETNAVSQLAPLLSSINLAGCKKITNGGFQVIFNTLAQSASLQYLNLSGCLLDDSSNLESLLKGSTKLQTFYISGCKSISPATLFSLPSSLNNLNVSGSSGFSDELLQHLALKCNTSLLQLDLGGCKKLSSLSVQLLAENSTNLQQINISGCHDVTDETLATFVSVCTKLVGLNIAGCKYSNRTLTAVAKHLTLLTSLNISWNKLITREPLELMPVYHNTNIQCLWMVSCKAVDPLIVQQFRTWFPCLRKLYFKGNSNEAVTGK